MISEWIDVNDRLPEKGDDVLVVIQDKDNHFHTEIRWRSVYDDVIVDDNGFAIYPPVEERVLAWLPIPVYKVEKQAYAKHLILKAADNELNIR